MRRRMQWIHNLSVSAKLLMVFGFLVVLMLGIGIVGWIGLYQIIRSFDTLYTTRLLPAVEIGRINHNAVLVRNLSRKHIKATEVSAMRALQVQIDSLHGDSMEQIDTYLRQCRDSAERRLVYDFRHSLLRLHHFRQQELIVSSQTTPEAKKRADSIHTQHSNPQLERVIGSGRVFLEHHRADGATLYHHAAETATSTQTVFLVVFLSALVIGGWFLFVITSSISWYTRTLATAAVEVAAGTTNVSVPVISHDELGTVATGFNQMVAKLNEQRIIADELNALSNVLRGDKPLDVLAEDILRFLAYALDVQAGALYAYTLGSTTNSASPSSLSSPISPASTFVRYAGYALRAKDANISDNSLGSNLPPLLQQAATDRTILVMRDIPPEQLRIHSRLDTDIIPRHLIAIPVLYQGDVVGLLELWKVQAWTYENHYFMEAASEAIAVSLLSAYNRRLLADQNEHLEAANAEIQRQLAIQDEQAREIEITNTALQEKNLAIEYALKQLNEQKGEIEAMGEMLAQRNNELQAQLLLLDEQKKQIELANAALEERGIKLEEARKVSDNLLQNVLPSAIAERLKAGESKIADKFDDVTVLFADLVGFTNLSATTSPEQVVEILNVMFSAFDVLNDWYRLEKIKTIGDAYMLAGGLLNSRPDHTTAAADMALAMLSEVHRCSKALGVELQVRIGIHCGEATAGVIGQKKFIYDLWGDTVNTASRMESHGEAGKIHVSDAVYHRLREDFFFEDRGLVAIKGKQTMHTYFLVGRKRPEPTVPLQYREASLNAASTSSSLPDVTLLHP